MNGKNIFVLFHGQRCLFLSIFLVQTYALKIQAPPAALILFSAFCEKYLALTMTGCFGICPRPNSL